MNAALITLSGCEQIAADEIKTILGKESKQRKSVVLFEATDKELTKLAYLSRSAKRILKLLHAFTINEDYTQTTKLIKEKIETVDFTFLKDTVFGVRCERLGSHDYNSVDIAGFTASVVANKSGATSSVKHSKIHLFTYIFQNELYFGIDIANENLSKRDYKLFNDSHAVNGVVGYSVVHLAQIKEGENVLDPMIGSGTIIIEAALTLAKKSVHFFKKDKFETDVAQYDQDFTTTSRIIGYDSRMAGVRATRKNAQIAGINKSLEFSKIDLEWIDTKLEENSIHKVVTKLPAPSKTTSEKKIEKLYKEFFHQTEFIVPKGGRVVVCLMKKELFLTMKPESFNTIQEIEVMQGKQPLQIVVLERK